MACRSCRSALDLLPRGPVSLRRSQAAKAVNGSGFARRIASPSAASQVQARRLHASPSSREAEQERMSLRMRLFRPIAERMAKVAPGVAEPYQVWGQTKEMYNACARQADYDISENDRKEDKIKMLEDGEELGTGSTMWHSDFQLLPTFSTWSQVTMLHLWLLTVRMRCFDKDEYETWQKQLIDHFFFGAEAKMEHTHGLSSASMRQRYLKDLFTQWRGALLSYDHGLVTDDATLAAAVWRNVFKAREDMDMRLLAAVVSWMRLCLRQLGEMSDDEFLSKAGLVFKNKAAWELLAVDRPVPELEGILGKKDGSSP